MWGDLAPNMKKRAAAMDREMIAEMITDGMIPDAETDFRSSDILVALRFLWCGEYFYFVNVTTC